MKCNKCEKEISREVNFCPFCGEKIERKYTNKSLFLIFTVEIIILFLISLWAGNYLDKMFDEFANETAFRNYVNDSNYILMDSDQGLTDNEHIVSDDIATNDEETLDIHYVVVDSDANAVDLFNNVYYQIESEVQSGMKTVFVVNLFNYNYYSLENNGYYYVVSQNANVVFAGFGLSSEKEEINKIAGELGFDYLDNIYYFISYVIGYCIIFILVVSCFVLWKIFVKAGIKGWKALIPYYNLYCLSKITFNKGWYFIFMLIPPINIIFMLITFYKLAKKFNKSTVFAVLSIFFPYITMQIIAFDNSEYNKIINNKKDNLEYNKTKMTNNNPNITSDNTEIKEVKTEKNIVKKIINVFKWFITVILLLFSAIILLIYIDEKLSGYLVLAVMFLIYGLMACPTISECTKKYKTYTKFKILIILLLIMINFILFAVLPF